MFILDNSPLSDVSSATIFSQSVAYLLNLLTLSFEIVFLFSSDIPNSEIAGYYGSSIFSFLWVQ